MLKNKLTVFSVCVAIWCSVISWPTSSAEGCSARVDAGGFLVELQVGCPDQPKPPEVTNTPQGCTHSGTDSTPLHGPQRNG